jgi:hypothetical protein
MKTYGRVEVRLQAFLSSVLGGAEWLALGSDLWGLDGNEGEN